MTVAARYANQDAYTDIIVGAASEYNIPVELIQATIAQESEFNPNAYRAEPQINDASRGLMQLLLGTAKQLGYTGTPDGLYDPTTNIYLGAKYIAGNVAYAESNGFAIDSAISMFNAGPSLERPGDGQRTTDDASGPFVNQSYVDRVQSLMTYFAEYNAQNAPAPNPNNGPGGTTTIGVILGILAVGAVLLFGGAL